MYVVARRDPGSRNGSAVHFLPSGNLIFMRRLLGFYEITPLGELVDETVVIGGNDRPHHDFIILDDGRILYLGRYRFPFDDSANGGDGETTARVSSLSVYDTETGKFERVWEPLKFWDITDPPQRVCWPGENPDWTHLNSLSRSPDGGWIMSSRHRHQVVSVSPDFQTVRWQLGGPDSDFDFPDPSDRFDTQHTATQLPNGNIPGGEGHYSRALELRLDFDAMTAVKAWEFSPDPPIYARIFSSAYRLDNGNTLINFGHSEDPANVPIAVIEVDADGREIFRLETIDPTVAEEASIGPSRYRANPGPESVIGETMLRAPKPKP